MILLLMSSIIQHAYPANGNVCSGTGDLAANDWIFILGTGRSGSTTLLQMVNALPNVQLSGEHDAELDSFIDLRNRLRVTLKHAGSEAWLHDRHQLKEAHLFCTVQSWFFMHTGKPCNTTATHGFKEIRYNSFEQLNFLRDAFPGAKFILNFRREVLRQSRSAWYKNVHGVENALNKTNAVLQSWAEVNRARAYLLPLEDFTPGNFTELFKWLGFSNCKAIAVTHTNNGGKLDGYQDALGEPVLSCA